MEVSFSKHQKQKLYEHPLLWIGLILIGLILKAFLFPVRTGDFIVFLEPWINFIKSHGYESSLKFGFYDYTPTYIYILIGIAKSGLNPLFMVKAVSVVFEFLAAFFVGKIAYLKYQKKLVILISVAAIPLLPTVILNSSYLSQCDSIYVAVVFASIYYLLKKKQLMSVILLGVAFAFKMQTIFILPFFFVAMLRGNIRWFYFGLIPVIFLISLLPAMLYGRSFQDLIMIYVSQANHYRFLTLNFPNLYIWLDNQDYDLFKLIGLIITFGITLVSGLMLCSKRIRFSYEMWIQLSLLSAVVIPFVLPGMHERYMYLGDILSVLYYIVFRKNGFVPAGILLVSLYSYVRCSRFNDILPMEPAFFIYLAIIVFLILDFSATMKKSISETAPSL